MKRPRTTGDIVLAALPREASSRMDTLTTELFLRILSFLDAHALAGVQGVNSYWARMSLDPQVSTVFHMAGLRQYTQ